MCEIGREIAFRDLKQKLRLALHDGTFLDDDEVSLILIALAHAKGIEKAFCRMFSETFVSPPHEERERKDKK